MEGYVTNYLYSKLSLILLGIFTEKYENSPEVHIVAQKYQNTQSNLEQKEQFWRYHNT
jgi:hypothetical protein